MKKTYATILITTAVMLVPHSAFALTSEMHVTKDGSASMSQAKVMQIAGNTFFARLYWSDAFIRFTIKTNSATKFFRGTGEATTRAEIKEGDILDVVGTLETGSDTLNLVATSVKNSSVQKGQATLSGTVTSIDLSQRQFTMSTKDNGDVTVKTGIATPFLKGTRTLTIGDLHVGDTVTKTSGDFDYTTKILITDKVSIYTDMSVYKPQNYIGKLTETPTTGATSIKITVGKIIYAVYFNDKTGIMRANRSAATLARFVAGDSIRFYGTRREVDDPIIDAEVIRNTDL